MITPRIFNEIYFDDKNQNDNKFHEKSRGLNW